MAEDDKVVFKYVYIPADQTEGIEERTFECPQSDDVLGFINMCKAHFRNMSAPHSREEQQQWQQAFKASMGDKAKGVSDDMLNMLAGQQMVEPIALLANSPDTGFVGVYMYCDDQATLKHLPHNMRATQIAAEAGQALQVSGDVFIGRYFDNEEDFQRLDFTLSELSSSAAWMKDARQQIMRRSERSGSSSAQELLQRLQHPQQGVAATGAQAGSGAASSPSDVEKDKGNVAYKKRDFHAALEFYTAAIKLDHANTAARNNRALTYLSLNMYKEAAADAAEVLKTEPSNVKALLRRAAAEEGMGRLQDAAADCRAALQLEPRNTGAQQRLAELEQQLAATSGQQQQQQQEQQQEEQQGFPPPPAEP